MDIYFHMWLNNIDEPATSYQAGEDTFAMTFYVSLAYLGPLRIEQK